LISQRNNLFAHTSQPTLTRKVSFLVHRPLEKVGRKSTENFDQLCSGKSCKKVWHSVQGCFVQLREIDSLVCLKKVRFFIEITIEFFFMFDILRETVSYTLAQSE
jgi:hypothetical protein